MKLWRSVGPDDCVITLGFDPGEYSLNLATIPAGQVWNFTGWTEQYGHIAGEFRHRVRGNYDVVHGDLDAVLREVIPQLSNRGLGRRPPIDVPERLNTPHLPPAGPRGRADSTPSSAQLPPPSPPTPLQST